MTNNDILRRVRYAFDFDDAKIIQLFSFVDVEVTRSEVCNWLKRDDDDDQEFLKDEVLATFLNGLIVDRRGKREGPAPKPEKRLSNNVILNKFKIALSLKAEEMIEIFEAADFAMNKNELSSYFRKKEHRNYRDCREQVLRKFIQGLQKKYRTLQN